MVQENSKQKIAFITDERLSHDRKTVFTRLMSILRPKYNIEFISTHLTEADFIDHLKKHDYSLVLLPWHKYLTWKKVESHFGALRLQGPTVAGYFADAVLPFEFSKIPNYHRIILLDFYRFDQFEVEMMLGALLYGDKKAGFGGVFAKNTPIFYSDWHDTDAQGTRCVDSVMNAPLFQAKHWEDRLHGLRATVTAFWSMCFRDQSGKTSSDETRGLLEVGEFHKRLAMKFVFETQGITLKNMMEFLWPTSEHHHQAIEEISKQADFLRIQHFPESHQIEITAFFTPRAPSLKYPGEFRGIWIEPLKARYLKNSEEEQFLRRIPIAIAREESVTDQLSEVLERLRAVHLQLGVVGSDKNRTLGQQISNIRFLVSEIEKKVAEKKKAA